MSASVTLRVSVHPVGGGYVVYATAQDKGQRAGEVTVEETIAILRGAADQLEGNPGFGVGFFSVVH
jgi:hypothetical protein